MVYTVKNHTKQDRTRGAERLEACKDSGRRKICDYGLERVLGDVKEHWIAAVCVWPGDAYVFLV